MAKRAYKLRILFFLFPIFNFVEMLELELELELSSVFHSLDLILRFGSG